LGRRRTAEIHGSAWPYLSGCLAEVFIWGPMTAASAFPRFLRGSLLERLVDINVLIDSITYRDPPLWID
jgi:hypothetical protein